ncbi:G-protein coupled receptor 39-like [Erpetoichthys calabaricus]|uniref:G-protein coupled receptor 39-like n=1 Tax=Erpetoichthys calabaricus TaxID=27687 RepID=UPI0010A07449|nr:G-protein coupled receptor 39-like [Erpetoichthys calabaricus]XP_051786719.1 G-protein coupled receptor 39-like [Erpetoichthys calabaricus]XP_051786720.1 G-protein coupled receptor 39-like [Erpetoichthys calabaricus]XP_051786721.1 G-protein coupled receptor 39-like [Erpetoichthys calabaricus]XP_051786722.1 G-protein coupled receptor 39-like [Erpetoichthys calabaricus]XP_051786723.1 G-protein coupled receptor 39-like [Erpetoichthys calabaricus]
MADTSECKDFFTHAVLPELEPSLAIKVFITLLYVVLLLVGIIGNGITIKVTQVLKTKGYLQKSVTDHMVSLACSDILVLLLGMPVDLYSSIWYPFLSAKGNASCKIYQFLFETCSYATILNVATLCFERYVAICHPFKYKSLSGSRTIKMICCVWLASVFIALPLPFAMGVEDPLKPIPNFNYVNKSRRRHTDCYVKNSTFTICTNLTSMWKVYQFSVFFAFIAYIVVLASVSFMCHRMMNALKATLEGTERESKADGKHESQRTRASRKQTIIFLGLIVAALAGCWMPNQIRRIMLAAVPKTEWTIKYFRAYNVIHYFADCFFYLSSVLNPFLYNLSSKYFRQVFLQVLRGKVTIEHINKKALDSTYSRRPLLISTLRRSFSKAKQSRRHKDNARPEGDKETPPAEENIGLSDKTASTSEPNEIEV